MENEKKHITLTASGIKCDNPACSFSDMTVPFEEYEKWVDRLCPDCGENLFPRKDFEALNNLIYNIEAVNQMTEEEIKNLPIPEMESNFDENIDANETNGTFEFIVNITDGEVSFKNKNS